MALMMLMMELKGQCLGHHANQMRESFLDLSARWQVSGMLPTFLTLSLRLSNISMNKINKKNNQISLSVLNAYEATSGE
jgi:hypothetical protein